MKDSTLALIAVGAAGLGFLWWNMSRKNAPVAARKTAAPKPVDTSVPAVLATPAAGMEWKNINGQWVQVPKAKVTTLEQATNPFAILGL